ncbi:MAG: proline dehydrogenase family protein, partial [Phycisphaerae bacterium]|nr:proline dehydrogenase family protein [Phycisphaerae bacterium]
MPDTSRVRWLEQRTEQIGRELFDDSRRRSPAPLSPRWWDERAMQWSMGVPALKGRLFRLVDVLPALPDRDAVLGHLKEYLAEPAHGANGRGHASQADMLVRLMRLAPPLLGARHTLRGRLSAAAVVRSARRLARRFIAGQTVEEAVQSALRLRSRRLAFTLDLLGEKVLSEREADAYAAAYLSLIRGLTEAAGRWPGDPLIDQADGGRRMPRVNLSIKLTGLYSQFDPLAARRLSDAVIARLGPILREARRLGAFIHVDMEHDEVKDLTLDLFERIAADPAFADWRDFGIVIQAYRMDSPADLDRVIALARRRGTP